MEPNLFKSFAKGAKSITKENNNCVIYTRVSGAKQMDGLSLETQLNGTNAYSQKNNLLVQEYFGGTYESAATDERKEFQRMIKYLKSKKRKISKILVYSLERFSRNENSSWLSIELRKLGIEIISITQPIDTTNPSGIMQQKLLFIFGEFDNQLENRDRFRLAGQFVPHSHATSLNGADDPPGSRVNLGATEAPHAGGKAANRRGACRN